MSENSKPIKKNELNRVFSALEVLDKKIEELFQSCHYFVNEAKYATVSSNIQEEAGSQRSRFVTDIERALSQIDSLTEKIDRITISIEQ